MFGNGLGKVTVYFQSVTPDTGWLTVLGICPRKAPAGPDAFPPPPPFDIEMA